MTGWTDERWDEPYKAGVKWRPQPKCTFWARNLTTIEIIDADGYRVIRLDPSQPDDAIIEYAMDMTIDMREHGRDA